MNRIVTGKAVACVLDEIGANLTPAIVIQWEIEGGRFRRSTHFLTDAALAQTAKSLQNAGFRGADPSVLDGADRETIARLLPLEVELVLEDEVNPNDGKTYETIRWVNKLGGAKLKSTHGMTAATKMATAAKFKAAAATLQQPEPTQPNNEPPDPFGDDDFAEV